GPAGASFAERRQLSGGSERNLSCTKFASICSGVPSSPAFTMRISSWIGGSKRFLWPPPRLTVFLSHEETARITSARESDSGFSQKTCLPAFAARTIWSVCRVCGVHRTTPWTSRFPKMSSKLFASETFCCLANSAAAGSGSATATTRSFALDLASGTTPRPPQPKPMTATLSVLIESSEKNRGLSLILGLVDGRSRRLRSLAPARGLVRDELRECRRRGAGHDLDAAVGEPRAHFACLHGLDARRIKPVDDLLRGAGWNEDALPGPGLEGGVPRLAHGRHVGQRLEALRRRDREHFEAPRLDHRHRRRRGNEHQVRLARG